MFLTSPYIDQAFLDQLSPCPARCRLPLPQPQRSELLVGGEASARSFLVPPYRIFEFSENDLKGYKVLPDQFSRD